MIDIINKLREDSMAIRIEKDALEYARSKGSSLTLDVHMGSG